MSDDHNSQDVGSTTAVIILIAAMVLLFSALPPVMLLLYLRVHHPEFFLHGAPREGTLPTVEQSPSNRAQHNSIFRRARAAVLKVRGVAVAAGGAVALRFREAFEKVRRRIWGPSQDPGRRLSELPIMRNKSWQILAESHTEFSFHESSKDDGVEYETVELTEPVKDPKKTVKTVQFDLGDEAKEEPCVQKPEPAVVAEVKM